MKETSIYNFYFVTIYNDFVVHPCDGINDCDQTCHKVEPLWKGKYKCTCDQNKTMPVLSANTKTCQGKNFIYFLEL